MVTAYRLFRSRYEPWDTTGARLRGGRWNSPGNGVIYTSATLSLACLEVLVHIRDLYLVPDLNYCRIEFPNHCVERWPFEADTARSQAILDSEVLSREFADGWLGGRVVGKPAYFKFLADAEGSGPVLAVPSVVVRQEWNYLINPSHRLYSKIRWSAPLKFRIESRLLDPLLR